MVVKKEKYLRYRNHNIVLSWIKQKDNEYSILVKDIDDSFRVLENIFVNNEKDLVFYINKFTQKYSKMVVKKRSKRKKYEQLLDELNEIVKDLDYSESNYWNSDFCFIDIGRINKSVFYDIFKNCKYRIEVIDSKLCIMIPHEFLNNDILKVDYICKGLKNKGYNIKVKYKK